MARDGETQSSAAGGGSAKGFDLHLAVMALGVAACFLPWITPPIALGIGICLALLGLTAYTKQATKVAKYLIQVAVVMLGLGMNLRQVGEAGLVGLAFAAGTIVGTFALGIALGRALKIEAKLTTLLSSGTAICGGSAIAATASVIAASEAQIAVAMGAVFLLNAVAIYVFPWLGHAMELNAEQFGTWAAVAIHDVSSVVTASGEFDKHWPDEANPALASQTATAVKLTRTLWIAPVALACAWWFARKSSPASAGEGGRGSARPGEGPRGVVDNGAPGSGEAPETWAGKPMPRRAIQIPWFVLWFVVAAAIGTFFRAEVEQFAGPLAKFAKEKLMGVALLLIGCGLSPKAVAQVGWRAMVLAVVLWVAISAAALWVVKGMV